MGSKNGVISKLQERREPLSLPPADEKIEMATKEGRSPH
jgi:hypothetical protein